MKTFANHNYDLCFYFFFRFFFEPIELDTYFALRLSVAAAAVSARRRRHAFGGVFEEKKFLAGRNPLLVDVGLVRVESPPNIH